MPDDHIPDGRLHAKLTNLGWQAYFRLYVGGAFHSQRDALMKRLTPCADQLTADLSARACLEQLRDFLINSAADAGPYDIYAGAPEILDAYEMACRMFSEGDKRVKASGRPQLPIKTLAHINALLCGEDPHKAWKDADDLVKDVVRVAGQHKPIEVNPPIRCTHMDVLRANGLEKRAKYLDELESKGELTILERRSRKQPFLVHFKDPKYREKVERSMADFRRDGTKPARKAAGL